MTKSQTVIIKQVSDMLIAGIRFRGEYDEVPQRFRQLHEQVEPYVNGPGILLHHYFDQSVGPGYDLEVSFPVRQSVDTGEIRSRILEGGQILSAVHAGPLGTRGEPGGISDTWRTIWDYVLMHSVIPDSAPRREVYLEDARQHGDNTDRYLAEVQLCFAFFRMEKLEENLEKLAGSAVRQEVMAGSEGFADLSSLDRAIWFKGAVDRLDGMVKDEVCRHNIMVSVGDQFPRSRIKVLRDEYQRTRDLDKLLMIMGTDRTLGDRSWYEQPWREDNIIYVTKDPVHPEEYQQATNDEERRAAYCHCRRLQEAILEGMTFSGTYCSCGAGWYDQLWEGILEEPVRVEVVRSVLQGDNDCTFAIHLPESAVHPA